MIVKSLMILIFSANKYQELELSTYKSYGDLELTTVSDSLKIDDVLVTNNFLINVP
jgi:hypothetical protein